MQDYNEILNEKSGSELITIPDIQKVADYLNVRIHVWRGKVLYYEVYKKLVDEKERFTYFMSLPLVAALFGHVFVGNELNLRKYALLPSKYSKSKKQWLNYMKLTDYHTVGYQSSNYSYLTHNVPPISCSHSVIPTSKGDKLVFTL